METLDVFRCMQILGTLSVSMRRVNIAELEPGWLPSQDPERTAFAWLLSETHRDELKAWYRQFSDINPQANEFRRYLERCIGESLPLKGQT